MTRPTQRNPDRVRGVLGLLACIALAVVIAVVVPDPTTDVRRRYEDVRVGELAATEEVGALVTRVQLTRSVQSEYGDPFISDQALVVVSVEASARQRVWQYNKVVLRTEDERNYEPRSEFIGAGLAETQPGFTRSATLVFEVPPDRVPGARLVVDPDSASFDTYATALRVDLGLRAPVDLEPGPVKVLNTTVRVT